MLGARLAKYEQVFNDVLCQEHNIHDSRPFLDSPSSHPSWEYIGIMRLTESILPIVHLIGFAFLLSPSPSSPTACKIYWRRASMSTYSSFLQKSCAYLGLDQVVRAQRSVIANHLNRFLQSPDLPMPSTGNEVLSRHYESEIVISHSSHSLWMIEILSPS